MTHNTLLLPHTSCIKLISLPLYHVHLSAVSSCGELRAAVLNEHTHTHTQLLHTQTSVTHTDLCEMSALLTAETQ